MFVQILYATQQTTARVDLCVVFQHLHVFLTSVNLMQKCLKKIVREDFFVLH